MKAAPLSFHAAVLLYFLNRDRTVGDNTNLAVYCAIGPVKAGHQVGPTSRRSPFMGLVLPVCTASPTVAPILLLSAGLMIPDE